MESMSISFIWPSSMVNLLYRLFGTPPSGASGGRKSGDYLPPRQGPPETPPGAAPLDPTFKKPLLVRHPRPRQRTASSVTCPPDRVLLLYEWISASYRPYLAHAHCRFVAYSAIKSELGK